jgi:hypothetical protein
VPTAKVNQLLTLEDDEPDTQKADAKDQDAFHFMPFPRERRDPYRRPHAADHSFRGLKVTSINKLSVQLSRVELFVAEMVKAYDPMK